jgi:hypothetical protein
MIRENTREKEKRRSYVLSLARLVVVLVEVIPFPQRAFGLSEEAVTLLDDR